MAMNEPRDTRRTVDFGDLLPDLETAVEHGKYKSLSECVRALVREGLERRTATADART